MGAIGFISVLVPSILPMLLVKVDEETREVIRDPDTGLCVPCQPGEPGEFLGKIVTGDPAREFHGYVDSSASSKKVLRDVRTKGDIWFRSGDVLEMDEFGWLYFKDRTGDTFRWKGENVSTTEVEAVLSGLVGLQDAIVYGVEVREIWKLFSLIEFFMIFFVFSRSPIPMVKPEWQPSTIPTSRLTSIS